MASQRQHDPEQRIHELEARVAALSSEVESLRAERRRLAQSGRRAGDPKPPEPPLARRIWLGRLLLLLMAAILASAATAVVRQAMAGSGSEQDLWRQFATFNINYTLLGLTCLGTVSLFAYFFRRFLTFITICLTCIYATFWTFIAGIAEPLNLSARGLFWTSIIYLTLCFAVASWLGIYESLRPGRARKRAMWVALANTVAFCTSLYLIIQRYAPDSGWYIYIALAILAGFFAVLAESIGSYRNYLFQVFTATAILLLNVALQDRLSEERLLLALAIECLVLAAAYHASGIVVLKVLNLAALAVTVVLALRATKLGTPVPVAGVTLRENWLYGLTTCGLLVFAAYYYQRHIRSLDPHERRLSGHWFLADSFWDVPSTTAGLLHGAAAALIVVVLTIADFGDHPSLPYMLAAESIGFAVLGFVLRIPQLEVSAVMLVVASHVSYYFFLAIGKTEFSDQPNFLPYTVLVIAYTYFLAFRWEKYLHRLQKGHPWEHYFSAAVPYLVATAMLLTVVHRQILPMYVPVTHCAIGLGFILMGAAIIDGPIKTSGVAALCAGVAVFLDPFVTKLSLRSTPLDAWGVPVAILVLLVLSERALLWGRRVEREQAVMERLSRSVLSVLFAAMGFVSVREFVPDDSVQLLWLGFVCLCIVLGTVFRENRYRWMAVFVLAGALAWTFAYEHMPWSDRTAKLFAGGSVGVFLLLIGSWGFTMRRTDGTSGTSSLPSKGVSADG